jgi:hypothetical protein
LLGLFFVRHCEARGNESQCLCWMYA